MPICRPYGRRCSAGASQCLKLHEFGSDYFRSEAKNKWRGWRSFVGETGSVQADIHRFLGERRELRIGLPGTMGSPCCQRVELRSELDPLGKSGPRVLDVSLEPERRGQAKMDIIETRIGAAGLSKKVDVFIHRPSNRWDSPKLQLATGVL